MKNEIANFGKRLHEAHLKKKMSQGGIAKKLGVHQSYISGLEHGKRNPSLLTMNKMADALAVSPKN